MVRLRDVRDQAYRNVFTAFSWTNHWQTTSLFPVTVDHYEEHSIDDLQLPGLITEDDRLTRSKILL